MLWWTVHLRNSSTSLVYFKFQPRFPCSRMQHETNPHTITLHSRTCGSIVCDSCSRARETIKNEEIRMCLACHTYLHIRQSGCDPKSIIAIINECLRTYDNKWSRIRTLLLAHQRILKEIQFRPGESQFSSHSPHILMFLMRSFIMRVAT